MAGVARRVLSGKETTFDPNKLRPPVHVVLALEEPENSLAPQFLGRIVRQLRGACDDGDVQGLALIVSVPEADVVLDATHRSDDLGHQLVAAGDSSRS